jgi:CheY-like chemotaxis protein
MSFTARILWADDEIDLLKPHLLFLEQKGYEVIPVLSGKDAIDEIENGEFDIVFLDENMPGISGLETLEIIKRLKPTIPIVMITKSEEEFLMEDAIGSQISDYLIKPVNPKQILSSLKKILDNRKLISDKVNTGFQRDFSKLSISIMETSTHQEWVSLYKNLVHWDLEFEKTEQSGMREVFDSQFDDANRGFSKFIEKNYVDWIKDTKNNDRPTLSHNVLDTYLLPYLDNDKPIFLLVIDNLRYDQWRIIQKEISDIYRLVSDNIYYSILPTATQYARNALFAGLLPNEMEKRFPKFWKNDEDEGGKNQYEDIFFADYLNRNKINAKFSYNKITSLSLGKTLIDNLHTLEANKINILVYNFVDFLSHARTEMEVLKELAEDEAAYRSITKSWFNHSPLKDIIYRIADKNYQLMITTDHGTIKVKKPVKILADKNTTTNIRYKTGKNLNYDGRDVFKISKPEEAGLPKQHLSSTYAFSMHDAYFVYPNNYNYFVNFYKNTFQHGGVSLEEVLIPFGILETK